MNSLEKALSKYFFSKIGFRIYLAFHITLTFFSCNFNSILIIILIGYMWRNNTHTSQLSFNEGMVSCLLVFRNMMSKACVLLLIISLFKVYRLPVHTSQSFFACGLLILSLLSTFLSSLS